MSPTAHAPPRILPGSFAAWSQAMGLGRGFLFITPLPVAAGALAAGGLRPLPVLGVLVGAWLLHAGTNLANEYYDHLSGTDERDHHLTPFSGGTRAIQDGLVEPGSVRNLAILAFVLGTAWFAALDRSTPGVLLYALAGAAAGWTYTAPPLALAYRGLGELVVGLNFGPLLAACAATASTGTAPPAAWIAGALLSLLSIAVLLVNEVPDTPSDRAAGKHHLVVRLGEDQGMALARTLLLWFPVVLTGAVLLRALPPGALVALAATGRLRQASREIEAQIDEVMERPESDPDRYAGFVAAQKATLAAKFQAGWLLVAGLVLALVPGPWGYP